MASIYRFSRKNKEEDPKLKDSKKSDSSGDFFPLLFAESSPLSDEEETVKNHDNKNEQALQREMEETKVISFAKDESAAEELKADDKKIGNEDTVTFEVAEIFSDRSSDDEEEQEDEKARLSEDFLRAFSDKREDQQKIEEVYHHSKGSISADMSRDEIDNTTALLMEIFGTDSAKKKKEKEVQDAELHDEIHGIFSNAKRIEDVLESIQAENLIQEENSEAENGTASADTENSDYVAVHNAEEECTKEYHATFSIEEALNQITPQAESNTVPELAEEVRVSDSDNLYSDTYDEIEEKSTASSVLPEEFTSDDEFDEFAEHLRNRNFKTLVTTLWSFVAFLALFYLESATFSNLYHPSFLTPGGIYNTIYLVIDIQLIFLASLPAITSLGNGAKGLFTGRTNRAAAPFLLVIISILHALILLITDSKQYPLFGSVAALFVLLNCFADFLDAKRLHRSFRICGKRGEKLVADPVGDDSAEAEAFAEQFSEAPLFFSVRKASFIDRFFHRASLPGKAEKSHLVTLLIALVLSLAFAVLTYWKSHLLADAFTSFTAMAMMSFPLCGILTVVLPFSHLSRKAEKKGCAIVGCADADRNAEANVVSFTDKEIFPPRSVKVNTIRTYGQTRIDKAILYSAMIFQKLGGPLSLVFKKTISGVYSEIPEDFDFLEITADGMCAKIEGKDVFVGNKNYLLSYDFGYAKDEMDRGFEARSGKIMYMVIGSELAAKFYIRYSISTRFKKTILSLFKAGICPAVKTCDPNIDSDLFRALLQNDKIPAGIIKTCDAMKDAPVAEHSNSGVVCTTSIANLLHTFSLCSSLKQLARLNAVIKLLALLIGAGVVLFLYLIGDMEKISGLFAVIYQLLWLIPVIIPSLSE